MGEVYGIRAGVNQPVGLRATQPQSPCRDVGWDKLALERWPPLSGTCSLKGGPAPKAASPTLRDSPPQPVEGLFLQHSQWELLAEGMVCDTGELSQGLVDLFGADADALLLVGGQ